MSNHSVPFKEHPAAGRVLRHWLVLNNDMKNVFPKNFELVRGSDLVIQRDFIIFIILLHRWALLATKSQAGSC